MEGPHQARLQSGISAPPRGDLARDGRGAEGYECAKGVAYAEKVQAESPVVDRWNDYMKDILELEMDPVTGAQPKLEQVFRLD